MYDFNNIYFEYLLFGAKQMSASMEFTFVFVEHIGSHVLIIKLISLTLQRKISLNLFSIQLDLINYTFSIYPSMFILQCELNMLTFLLLRI